MGIKTQAKCLLQWFLGLALGVLVGAMLVSSTVFYFKLVLY